MRLLKRILFWSGIGLLSLVVLSTTALALFIGWMKWSGERDWKRVQAELHARGEKLTFEELLPPPPPESENFYADPMWQQLTDLVEIKRDLFGFDLPGWKPRMPDEKLLINQWKKPLSPLESDKFHSHFLGSSDISVSSRAEALSELGRELKNTDNQDRRRQIAQVTLDLIQPTAPFLSRISELAKLPYAYFPVRYESGFGPALPHLPGILDAARLLAWRSGAELELGETSEAATDVQTMLYLSSALDREPLLISHLVELSVLGLGLHVIDKGIAHHQWSDPELTEFLDILKRKDLVGGLCYSLDGERVSFDLIAHTPWHKISSLLFFLQVDAIYCEGEYFTQIQHRIDLLKNSPNGVNATTLPDDRGLGSLKEEPIKSFLHVLQRLALPAVDSAVRKTVETQIQLSQTVIACGLERYLLAHGSYPSSLDALVPEYLASVPKEATTGKPMHYRLQSDGTFLLWAPGWKIKTLDGKPGEHSGEGDIIWNLSIPRMSGD